MPDIAVISAYKDRLYDYSLRHIKTGIYALHGPDLGTVEVGSKLIFLAM